MMTLFETVPGETPIDDISELRVKNISTRKELSFWEAENIRKVQTKYLAGSLNKRLALFHCEWAKRLHQEMFCDVWKWAGRTRKEDLNMGIHWPHVETRLHSLFENLVYWQQNSVMSVEEQAAQLHHQAVWIHPFHNGNGRWARMLANIWLKLNGHPLVIWPEEMVGTESAIRQEYLAAIRQADQGDIELLLELHKRYAEVTIPPRRRPTKAPAPHPLQLASKSKRTRMPRPVEIPPRERSTKAPAPHPSQLASKSKRTRVPRGHPGKSAGP